MQPEERDLIAGLFGRLGAFEAQPRDPDAERLIAGAVAAQPGAPYLLVQTVLIQEQALKSAQQHIAELEALQAKASAAPAPGFLASAPRIGPWGSAAGSAPAAAPVTPTFAAPPAGGGFLRQALTTAAGVAGGALLFEGIRNMLGGQNSSAFGAAPAQAMDTSSLMPSDNITPADLAQDDGAADDYDTASDDSDSGGFDSGGGSDDL